MTTIYENEKSILAKKATAVIISAAALLLWVSSNHDSRTQERRELNEINRLQNTPYKVVTDVNGDGRPDVEFSKDVGGLTYIQLSNGKYERVETLFSHQGSRPVYFLSQDKQRLYDIDGLQIDYKNGVSTDLRTGETVKIGRSRFF
jgi:hypothetical protein